MKPALGYQRSRAENRTLPGAPNVGRDGVRSELAKERDGHRMAFDLRLAGRQRGERLDNARHSAAVKEDGGNQAGPVAKGRLLAVPGEVEGSLVSGVQSSAFMAQRPPRKRVVAWFAFEGWTEEELRAFGPRLCRAASARPGDFVEGTRVPPADPWDFLRAAGLAEDLISAMREPAPVEGGSHE